MVVRSKLWKSNDLGSLGDLTSEPKAVSAILLTMTILLNKMWDCLSISVALMLDD